MRFTINVRNNQSKSLHAQNEKGTNNEVGNEHTPTTMLHELILNDSLKKHSYPECWRQISYSKTILNAPGRKPWCLSWLFRILLASQIENISNNKSKDAIKIIEEYVKENKITVDEKELSNGMMQYASRYPGKEKEIIEYFKKNPSAIETIRGPILEEKVIESVISNAKINKVKVSKADYEKKQKEVFKFD